MRKKLRQVRVLAGNVGRPNHSPEFEQDHAPLQPAHLQIHELDAQPSKFVSGSRPTRAHDPRGRQSDGDCATGLVFGGAFS